MDFRHKVLIAETIAQAGLEYFRQNAEVDVRTGLTHEELVRVIPEYHALVVRSQARVTADVIEAGHKLQVIGRAGVGVDNIDVKAASRRGIIVVNAATANSIAAAEHTIGLMLALARNIPQANASLKSGKWERNRFMGVEVKGKTIGIIGLGNIGSEVAKRALGLEMQVVAYDPFVSTERAAKMGVTLFTVGELLRVADFVTLHTPLTPATRGLIGARELALMKPTARLINCARGELVDEEALYQAVSEDRIAGAALDVFSQEPATENKLCKSDKVIVTPHLAASTEEAQVNVALDIAHEIVAALRGEPIRYAVNAPSITPEVAAFLEPYLSLGEKMGTLCVQLIEGQVEQIRITYSGTISEYDPAVIKATILKGLLEPISEQRVTVVNSMALANERGLQIVEQRQAEDEHYTSLLKLQVTANRKPFVIDGTVIQGEPHIMCVDDYALDFIPLHGNLLFIRHRDRPGLIGRVGTILGDGDINISFMQVGRLRPRGEALMVLGVDEPVPPSLREAILAIPDIQSLKLARL